MTDVAPSLQPGPSSPTPASASQPSSGTDALPRDIDMDASDQRDRPEDTDKENRADEMDTARDGTDDTFLDHSSDTVAPEDNELLEIGDEDTRPEIETSEFRRVKVYQLVGSRWEDKGTAFCFGDVLDDGDARIVARAERDYDQIILSTIVRNDVYQRQQETLIVWTEPDGVDYALSFQDPDGCAEIWNFIVDIQNGYGASDDTPSSPSHHFNAETVAAMKFLRNGQLPSPTMGAIEEVGRALKAISRSPSVKERLCELFIQQDYIKQLIGVMTDVEDLESLEHLHLLCSLMQTILMLGDHNLYEYILEDEIFLGVVGMLEYDPEFPAHKANYRQFLTQCTTFHQPVPVRDPGIMRKIHHTYRLQFLKDVVLARVLDDSTFNVLNSCIIFNQIDIINHIQQEQRFLADCIRLYVDEDTIIKKKPEANGHEPPKAEASAAASEDKPKDSPKPNGEGTPDKRPPLGQRIFHCLPLEILSPKDIALRREVIFLIQQLCVMGKNIQLAARMSLFRCLVDRGILFPVQWALSLSESDETAKPVISAGGEILTTLLDHDLNGVRNHVLKHVNAIERAKEAGTPGAEKVETLLELVCRIVAQSKDLAVQSQIGEALKIWMDMPTDTGALAGEASHMIGAAKLMRKDEPGTERFLDYFYKGCAKTLFAPITDLPDWRSLNGVLPLTREETNRYVYLCDLLYNFTQHHNFRIMVHIMSQGLMTRVATLFRARDKHLRHSAFRFFRLLLRMNNNNMHQQMVKHDLFKPIIDLTLSESRRDNLLSGSCQDLFEHIRRENMKSIIEFIMKNHGDDIRKLAETPLGRHRFEMFIRRYEINCESPPAETKVEKTPEISRFRPSRAMDAEEEEWFNADEDDDTIPAISQAYARGTDAAQAVPSTSLKRKRRTMAQSPNKVKITPPRSPSLGQLAEYGDEDEEDGPQPRPADDRMQGTEDEPPERSRPESPSPGLMASMDELGPVRLGEKRRREEDEDEDSLERLSKVKKARDAADRSGGVKQGDDPPVGGKRTMKLKLGGGRATTASPTPSPTAESQPQPKNGDTG
ncbi:component of IIS longevity pathway SMK-1-domain-containing protein [Schizophyllum commune]